jgi:esterase/lipase superfamily enzyme
MNKIKGIKFSGYIYLLLLVIFLPGCQKKVYLMPTPAVFQTGEQDPFIVNPELEETNRVMVAYATNRLPVGSKDDRKYLTLFDKTIRLGTTEVRIGSEKETWMDIYGMSTSNKRKGEIVLELEVAKELAKLDFEDPLDELSPEARYFFEKLNKDLESKVDKDLILYVHGANNNFYRSSAQAAQFHHFTGRNSVVLFFAWPSAASLLRYAVDVNNASRTVPVFARLLELLSRYSTARNIDILAYSAGAQVLSPALAELRQKYKDEDIKQLKQRLRLGEVYFAAPDVDFGVFLNNLATYIDLPNHVTVAVNPDDSVLKYAARHHKISRAGRPDPDELSSKETRWVIDASKKMPLDILWITSETIPDMNKGSHSFWYSHPWVSTDVLALFLLQARPADRGLTKSEREDGGRIWYFPEDYPEQANRAINLLMEKHGFTQKR